MKKIFMIAIASLCIVSISSCKEESKGLTGTTATVTNATEAYVSAKEPALNGSLYEAQIITSVEGIEMETQSIGDVLTNSSSTTVQVEGADKYLVSFKLIPESSTNYGNEANITLYTERGDIVADQSNGITIFGSTTIYDSKEAATKGEGMTISSLLNKINDSIK
ncbi:MAG: hypothetical protein IMY73_04185 [Bacteroidetes bacterium]|nr:hypothetical protein [Bacteroidota bacterium]